MTIILDYKNIHLTLFLLRIELSRHMRELDRQTDRSRETTAYRELLY